MNPSTLLAQPSTRTVAFTLDQQTLQAFEGETILQVAKRHSIAIPHLCHQDGLRPDGNCRACVVEIKGERSLAPSCCRTVTAGMDVQAQSERALKSQKMVLELLLSDLPDQGHKWTDAKLPRPAPRATGGATESAAVAGNGAPGQHGELSQWAARMKVQVRPELRALRRAPPAADLSHPAMAVHLDACIQCKLCLRACREEQVNDVIGYARRGADSRIVFDLDDAMGSSTCVACGECVQVCPTGALIPKSHIGSQAVDKAVDSVCPYCGVGCLLTYQVRDNKIVSALGRDGPANRQRLCVKGRFGFDYVHSPQRLQFGPHLHLHARRPLA